MKQPEILFTPQERNTKLQFLHKCMLRYELMSGEDMAELKTKLYARCKVSSRGQLTDRQLKNEIDYFLDI